MKLSLDYNSQNHGPDYGASTQGVGASHRFIERDKRYDVRLWARARQIINDLEVSVMITNLSRSGCKVDSQIALDPKAPLLLTYRDYPSIRAQIMWSKTGAHGCKFEKPIPDEIFEAIIEGG